MNSSIVLEFYIKHDIRDGSFNYGTHTAKKFWCSLVFDAITQKLQLCSFRTVTCAAGATKEHGSVGDNDYYNIKHIIN